MTTPMKQDENLRRCPNCAQDTLMLHSKARTWLCRNCGFQEPLPDSQQENANAGSDAPDD